MSRNPMAGSLKHFRQRIVPDKREKVAEKLALHGYIPDTDGDPER
jgi:hypothetical protein